MNANMLIRFFTIVLPLCVFISCGSNQEKKGRQQALPAVSNIENTPVGETGEPEEIPPAGEDEETELDLENLPFAELIRRVPITPLPIGVEGLDSMFTYGPLGDPLLFFDYDSLNLYGLNDYFFNHPELDKEDDPTPWVTGSPPLYFSKRLPPLGNKEILLFYQIDNYSKNKDYFWQVYVCEQNGKIFLADPIMQSLDRLVALAYIDKDYILKRHNYGKPFKPGRIPGHYENNIGDEVSDSITEKNLGVLHFVSRQHILSLHSVNVSEGIGDRRYYWKQGRPVIYRETIDGKTFEYPILIEGEEGGEEDGQ